jgi:hypothetical protein
VIAVTGAVSNLYQFGRLTAVPGCSAADTNMPHTCSVRHFTARTSPVAQAPGDGGHLSTCYGRSMALGRVLVIGVDPAQFPEWDPEPVRAAIARGQATFGDHGIEADLCLVTLDEDPEGTIAAALIGQEYACVVIGGGIRKHEPFLELFETVVNLVRRHAPAAAIAFNNTPDDTADAALRWLR